MFLFAPVCIFILGLCVGSFLNVVVLRFGFSERSSQRSRCMACDHELAWYDLVPIISFFTLRGRCRSCGSALSRQYPLMEAAVGALFLMAFLLVPPVFSFWSWIAFACLLAFLATLAALTVYDIRHTLVPLPFVWALIVSALGASVSQSLFSGSFVPFLDSALGGGTLFCFFILIVLLTRGRGMGAGDAYVAGAMGILLGLVHGIEAVMIGVWSGTVVMLAVLLLSSLVRWTGLFPKAPRVTMKTQLPLIPFLAFGTAVALFTGFSPIAAAAPLSDILFSNIL